MYDAGYYKEVGDSLVKAPHNVGYNGRIYINGDKDSEIMAALGYSWMTAAEVEAWHTAHPAPVTMQDYDDAMEAHLDAELVARGYTKRSPIEYTNSTNARWKQDAIDWQAHLDAVMTYGLGVMNDYKEGKTVPTLAEFKAALPKITWTVALEIIEE